MMMAEVLVEPSSDDLFASEDIEEYYDDWVDESQRRLREAIVDHGPISTIVKMVEDYEDYINVTAVGLPCCAQTDNVDAAVLLLEHHDHLVFSQTDHDAVHDTLSLCCRYDSHRVLAVVLAFFINVYEDDPETALATLLRDDICANRRPLLYALEHASFDVAELLYRAGDRTTARDLATIALNPSLWVRDPHAAANWIISHWSEDESERIGITPVRHLFCIFCSKVSAGARHTPHDVLLIEMLAAFLDFNVTSLSQRDLLIAFLDVFKPNRVGNTGLDVVARAGILLDDLPAEMTFDILHYPFWTEEDLDLLRALGLADNQDALDAALATSIDANNSAAVVRLLSLGARADASLVLAAVRDKARAAGKEKGIGGILRDNTFAAVAKGLPQDVTTAVAISMGRTLFAALNDPFVLWLKL